MEDAAGDAAAGAPPEPAPGGAGKAYLGALRSLPFVLLVFAVSFNFNGFFVYVLSAPVFLIEHLGRSPQAFGWLFVPGVAGMMAGSLLSGRIAGHWTQERTIATGFAVMACATVFNLGLNAALPPRIPWSVLPVMIYNFGMALAMPSLTLLALDLFPDPPRPCRELPELHPDGAQCVHRRGGGARRCGPARLAWRWAWRATSRWGLSPSWRGGG